MVNLAIDPPPASHRGSARRGLMVSAVSAAILAALAGAFWLGRITALRKAAASQTSATTPAPIPPPPPTSIATPTSIAAPTSIGLQTSTANSISASNATTTSAATITSPATGNSAATGTPVPFGPHRLSITLSGPLEDSVARALGDRGLAQELTQVINRLLVWELQVARDGRKGDQLDVVWTPATPSEAPLPSNEPVVEALRYASQKRGVFATYRYQVEGARFARYYRADGSELETRLADPPVADYEQITSLLRDGRRHKGVDFKTPVGSPVAAPFDGVIERRNWHFSANGNCLDLRNPASGRHAIFLHLDAVPKEMQVGRKVSKGEMIASSGNSGRSFAPHLHYQLEDASGRVLDPFEALKTERRTLPTAAKPSFEVARARLDAELRGGG